MMDDEGNNKDAVTQNCNMPGVLGQQGSVIPRRCTPSVGSGLNTVSVRRPTASQPLAGPDALREPQRLLLIPKHGHGQSSSSLKPGGAWRG
ncbi:unnamed protein product [Arctogadus glacialis]